MELNGKMSSLTLPPVASVDINQQIRKDKEVNSQVKTCDISRVFFKTSTFAQIFADWCIFILTIRFKTICLPQPRRERDYLSMVIKDVSMGMSWYASVFLSTSVYCVIECELTCTSMFLRELVGSNVRHYCVSMFLTFVRQFLKC